MPLGVGTALPRFSWEIESTERNVRQTAFRILLGTDESVAENGQGLCWDSGKLNSSAQDDVVYAGTPLKIRSGYYWKVMVWTNNGVASDWSDPAYFECGFFDIADWDSSWLGYSWAGTAPARQTVNHLRKEFTLYNDKPIKRARAYIAAGVGPHFNDTLRMNRYELRLNGRKVGNDLLNPGHLAPHRGRVLYRAYNIKTLLVPGKNAVGIIHASAKISLQLFIKYTDGSTVKINTGPDWRGNNQGPFTRLWKLDADEYGGKGEFYDAREEYTGWDQAGYDDSGWRQAVICSPPELLSAQMQSAQAREVLAPVSVSRLENGRFVVDFGKNINGHPVIRTKGKRGDRIILRYAENIKPDGSVDCSSTINARCGEASVHEDIYIRKGDGIEEYQARFANHGFRYVEISGEKLPAMPDIKANFVHSTVLNGSKFACSDERLQKLHDLCVQTLCSSLMSVPMDNPGRERNGWLGDAYACAQAECCNFDMRIFYEKWFNDIVDSQETSGYVPYCCPVPLVENGMDIVWSSGFVLTAWDAYRAYGEKSFLDRYYQPMKKWVEFMERLCDNAGIVRAYWGDCCGTELPSQEFLGTAYYYRCLDVFSKIAGELDKTNDAAFYNEKADGVGKNINRRFFRDGKYYDNGSQSANAHALYFGIASEQDRKTVLAALAADIEQKQAMTTGFPGTHALIMALAENGRNDVVHHLAQSDALGTWGYWLTHCNATTALETWNGKSGAHNQPMFIGGISAWFYRYLAGISPLEAGFKKIKVKPFMLGGVKNASAKIASVYGPIESSWRRRGGTFVIDVNLPANTTAEIHVPSVDAGQIYEDKSLARDPAGVEFLRVESEGLVFRVGSGRYSFHGGDAVCGVQKTKWRQKQDDN